jgi:N-acetylmuramoyl-L-alanine amidase
MTAHRIPTLLLLLVAVLVLARCIGATEPGALPQAAEQIAVPAGTAAVSNESGVRASATAEEDAPAAAEPAGGEPPAATTPGFALHPFQPATGRARMIALDPGHGGPEVGAAGAGVAEKDVNLRIAVKLKALLEADGFVVVLTRDGDHRAAAPPEGQAGSFPATRFDLQTRIDIANAAGADVFISIHNNGSTDSTESGTEVWWDGRRPWAAYNKALAEQVLGALLGAIRGAGHPVLNRGLKEDSDFRIRNGRSFPIFVLGPPRTGAVTTRATQMPSILGETLFLSNPAEARVLATDAMQSAIARGYRAGLLAYFRLIDEGALALPAEGLAAETPNHFDQPFPGSGPPNP